jgi:hypothetical protein
MARGVMVVSETQADAEHQVLHGGAGISRWMAWISVTVWQ